MTNDCQPWHEIVDEPDRTILRFLKPDDGFWSPDIIETCPLPTLPRGKPVSIEGRGAVWMYAHAGEHVARQGLELCRLQNATRSDGGRDTSNCINEFAVPGDGRIGFVRMDWDSPELLDDAVQFEMVETLSRRAAAFSNRPILVITGKATVTAYARLAYNLVQSGYESLVILAPPAGPVIVSQSDDHLDDLSQLMDPENPSSRLRFLELDRPGLAIGIIGDPNCGKSVFSKLLDKHRSLTRQRGWLLDCDASAPTPTWYLYPRRPAIAETLRKQAKSPWTNELEQQVSRQMQWCKRFIPITIADLPGGNHAVEPPQRIPPGRECMFAPLDKLIVLQTQQRPTAHLWLEELKRADVQAPIAAIISSRDHKAPPKIELTPPENDAGSVLHAVVDGLDRHVDLVEFAEGARKELNAIWNAVVRQSSGELP